jgi:phosphate:Na+ symporter
LSAYRDSILSGFSSFTFVDCQTYGISSVIHSVNDIERIGDHAENIIELAERKVGKKLLFSSDAVKEMTLMWNELSSMMLEVEQAFEKNDPEIAKRV